MTSLTQRDKYLLVGILVVAIIVGMFYFVVTPIQNATATTNEEIAALEGKVGQLDSLNDKAAKLTAQDQKLTNSINEKNITSFKTINKQEFIVFLTNKCKDNGVELTEFEDLGTTRLNNGTWKSMYDFQIRASHADILKICDEIDGLGIDYNVTSISLRQNLTLPWTSRLADQVTNTPWYTDNTKSTEEENAILSAVQKLQSDVDAIRQSAIDKNEEEERKEQESRENAQNSGSSSSGSYTSGSSSSSANNGNIGKTPNQAIETEKVTNPTDIGTRLDSLLGIGSESSAENVPQQSTQSSTPAQTSKPTQSKPTQQPAYQAQTVVVPDAVTITDKDVTVTQNDYYDGTMLFNITIEFVMYSDPYMSNNSSVDVMTSESGYETTENSEETDTANVSTEVADVAKKENE